MKKFVLDKLYIVNRFSCTDQCLQLGFDRFASIMFGIICHYEHNFHRFSEKALQA